MTQADYQRDVARYEAHQASEKAWDEQCDLVDHWEYVVWHYGPNSPEALEARKAMVEATEHAKQLQAFWLKL